MQNITYHVAPGARKVKRSRVQEYGQEIERIMEEKKGFVSPELIVEYATKRRNPLHDFFEWNDTLAAQEYRIKQAQYLLRSITITVSCDGTPIVPIKAFPNLKINYSNAPSEQGYLPIKTVQETPEYLAILIDDAHKELIGWKQRYRQYRNLERFECKFSPVFEAVGAL
jgi:hypothetical protein